MCFSFDENVKDLWELHENRKNWTSRHVFINVQKSWNDKDLMEINLMSTIGTRKAAKRKTSDEDFLWLPEAYSVNTAQFREKTLIPLFVRSCVDAGFNLVAKGWKEKRQALVFICNRGRTHKQNDSKEARDDLISRTCRPIRGEDETCKFTFKINWNASKQRWCIPKEQAGCRDHCGHTHREPHECRMYAKDYGTDALDLILDGLNSAIRPSLVSSLIGTREGHAIDPSQVRYLKKKMREATEIRLDVIEEMANGSAHLDPAYQPTPADRLLSTLESDPKYSYTVLYGQYCSNWPTNLMTLQDKL